MSYFSLIELLSTCAAAISGTSLAIKKKLDLFGIFIISFVTAIGGGTLRDILLGKTPVSWAKNESIVYIIIGSTMLTLLFYKFTRKLRTPIFLFDAMGLGLFSIIGIKNGLNAGLSPIICIAIGTVTGCFGGVIRDIFLNEIPLIFRKELYASISLLGGLTYFILRNFIENDIVNQWICICMIVVLRILAVNYRLSLPSINYK